MFRLVTHTMYYTLKMIYMVSECYVFHLVCTWAVATVVGTVVGFLVVPMRSLGQDNWKIAAALMGSYIGGSKFRELVQ